MKSFAFPVIDTTIITRVEDTAFFPCSSLIRSSESNNNMRLEEESSFFGLGHQDQATSPGRFLHLFPSEGNTSSSSPFFMN